MHAKFLVEEQLLEAEWDKLSKDFKKLLNFIVYTEEVKKSWLIWVLNKP
jgi:hypothetical protein